MIARANRVLRALSAGDYAALERNMNRVTLGVGEVLTEPLERARYVYFPETAVLSMVVVLGDRSEVEAASVGNEGIAGLSATLGPGRMTTRCSVLIAGDSQRIAGSALRAAAASRPSLDFVLRRYTQAFINQLAQSVACTHSHSIQQRCARRLLIRQDRVGGGDSFILTQEHLSDMLGVRREAVSGVAHALQEQGVIEYSRGHVTILNRAALEKISCECYAATRADQARTFSRP